MNTVCKFLALCTILTFTMLRGYAQNENPLSGLKPVSADKLALEFYKINFTKEQRKALQDVTIEFVFSLDETGQPTLEKVKNVNDPAVTDSLYRAAKKLPKFMPKMESGKPVTSIYFLQVQLPRYQTNYVRQQGIQDAIHYQQTKYEDFEYIHLSGQRADILFGGGTNFMIGRAGEHLGLGGGFKTGFFLTGRKGYGGGMTMNIFGNKLKKDFPLNSTREQISPMSMHVGVSAVKVLMEKENREFSIQLDLNMAVQNIIPKENENDNESVQFSGFSPGIVANYLIQFGKNKTGYSYGSPVVLNHHLNLFGALRPVFYNHKAASGVMVELGIGYRFRNNQVDEFKIKASPAEE